MKILSLEVNESSDEQNDNKNDNKTEKKRKRKLRRQIIYDSIKKPPDKSKRNGLKI